MDRPTPPPEAALLRLVRTASGTQAGDAAAALAARFNRKFSASRWSQIENGYETRAGEYKRVTANAATLAQMAAIVGITPERLRSETQRADAAEILEEILRSGAEPAPAPASDPGRALVEDEPENDAAWHIFPDDQVKRWIFRVSEGMTDSERAKLLGVVDRYRAQAAGHTESETALRARAYWRNSGHHWHPG